jgi:hypothetical protein
MDWLERMLLVLLGVAGAISSAGGAVLIVFALLPWKPRGEEWLSRATAGFAMRGFAPGDDHVAKEIGDGGALAVQDEPL